MEVTNAPDGEYVFDAEQVEKESPNDPESGLYDVTIGGIHFEVLATKPPP
jgi:hypothetical protein